MLKWVIDRLLGELEVLNELLVDSGRGRNPEQDLISWSFGTLSGGLSVRWLSLDHLFTQALNSLERESDLLGRWEDRTTCSKLNHNNLLLLGHF